ncbi:CRP-like cAMP-binding protein [Nitrospirillum amazonense]|uniref:CRP-like cAMP-binding protein n=1 Tax=Nitrospirillum amazonense TaxID=28077 RepID=A0A560FFY0_9PROT|nr:Crp/Fnr family transcriptional regulator [Nitrospirillum amazonense]TWB20504.1 CRP-like cAMP-binding protein [Nitrospirillum amazonense]
MPSTLPHAAPHAAPAQSAPWPPQALAGMELFRGLEVPGLAEVMAVALIRTVPRHTPLFHQGDPAQHCHALLSGGVRISQTNAAGAQVALRFIGAGEMFGSVPLFTDRLYPADAETVADSVEIRWTEASLRQLITRHPAIALNLVTVIGRRLMEVQDRLREVTTGRVEQRLARALLRLAARGKTSDTGTALAFPLTRKDLAELSGTTLHTASRTLAAWEKRGWLSSGRAQGRSRITLHDLAALTAVAEEGRE